MKINIITISFFILMLGACASQFKQSSSGSNVYSKDRMQSEILIKNTGKILTPELVDDIPKQWHQVADGFKIVWDWRGTLNKDVSKITGMEYLRREGDIYYFSYIVDGKDIENPKFMYKYGVQHTSYSNKPFSNSELYGECKFVIGECIQQITKTKKRRINTSFKDGLWMREYRGHGNSPATSITIYDRLGVELYRKYQAKNTVMEFKHVSVRKM